MEKTNLFNNKKIPVDSEIHGLYRRVNLLESSENLLSQPLVIEDNAETENDEQLETAIEEMKKMISEKQ